MTDLTADELIELLLKSKEENSKTRRKVGETKENASVKRFIKQWGLSKGTDRIPNHLIFYTYRVKWKGDHLSNKAKRITFFKTFR